MHPWEVFVWVIWTCLSGFLSSMGLGMKQTGCGWSGCIDWFRPSSWHLPPTVLQSQWRVLWVTDLMRFGSQTAELIAVFECVCVVTRGRPWACCDFCDTVIFEFSWRKHHLAYYVFWTIHITNQDCINFIKFPKSVFYWSDKQMT